MLHYREDGAGDPLVMLHGFSFDHRMWDDQVRVLAPRYRIIRPDLRGFGRSPAAEEPYSHAGDVEALVDHLQIDRPILMGLSMGGGAAINFAVQHPERVRALIVIDPSLGGFAAPEMAAAMARVIDAARSVGVAAARDAWLSLPLFTPALANAHCADRVRAFVGDYPGAYWLHADRGQPLTPPALQRLDGIRCPTLVIVGELDTPEFHAIADTLHARIAGSRKVVVAAAGHMANLEAPDAVNRCVLDFLERSAGL